MVHLNHPRPYRHTVWGVRRENPNTALSSVLNFHKEGKTHFKLLDLTSTGILKPGITSVLDALHQT